MNVCLADVCAWMARMKAPESEVYRIFDAAMNEDGILAALIQSSARRMLSIEDLPEKNAAEIGRNFAAFRSGQMATALLLEPDPSPDDVIRIVKLFRGLPRQVIRTYRSASDTGPRSRAGGAKPKIKDDEIREQVCVEIRKLRGPNVKLKDLYKRIGKRHGVSPYTIKRIWLASISAVLLDSEDQTTE